MPVILDRLKNRIRRAFYAQGEEPDEEDVQAVLDTVIDETQDRDRILGMALEDIPEGGTGIVNVGGLRPAFSTARGYVGSVAMYASVAYMGSTAMGMAQFAAHDRYRAGAQYQYTERFPPEVTERAWKLVEEQMKPDQYFAFMEGANIELENLAGDFRLIINKTGRFIILEGPRGSGIVAQEGNIMSHKYPLGDEISAFIDWFNHRTKELIAQWGCGVYGIVREGR